ncbi:hypothetical protein V8G54_025435 [Vigna mungo]|uniref:Uncharacterized protein n=1 Tax=Vigna mungo TaxID=3915 RepID=A0AAQ3MYD2_VIGMU
MVLFLIYQNQLCNTSIFLWNKLHHKLETLIVSQRISSYHLQAYLVVFSVYVSDDMLCHTILSIMYILPRDDGSFSAPFTFVNVNGFYLRGKGFGNIVCFVAENIKYHLSSFFKINIGFQLLNLRVRHLSL